MEGDTKPQFLGGLGEKLGGGSSVQQTADGEFGELSYLLVEPLVCLETSSTHASRGGLRPAKYSGQAFAAGCPASWRVPALCTSEKVGP